jgi:GTP-binding protein Era
MVAEMIREQVFLQTHQEIPYSTAVVVNAFKESEKIIHVQADIIVERDTQKGIIIGKKGSMLKAIGSAARVQAEKVFAKQLHLEIFVKVVPNWSKSNHRLRELGYGD